MRIVVHGQQAFGKSVLDALLERGENVVGVYCGPDPAGGRVDPLKEAALARGLPVHQPRSFRNKPEVWEEFARLKADLCVMAYVTLIVPEEVLNQPARGTIQYHPSLLPRHRGPSSINWPIIMGDADGAHDLLAGSGPGYGPDPAAEGNRHHGHRHPGQSLLRSALPDGGRGPARGRRSRA